MAVLKLLLWVQTMPKYIKDATGLSRLKFALFIYDYRVIFCVSAI